MKLFKFTLFAYLLAVSALQAQSWQPLAGLSGGKINELHRHKNTWYAGTGYGLYSSTDGQNWTRFNSLPRTTIDAMETIGNSLLVGSYNYGIYRTTNNGSTWTNVLTTAVHDLQLHNGCIYVATDANGVFKSCNEGQSWTDVSGILGNLVPRIASDEAYLYAMSGQQLFRSTGNGSWTDISANLPGTAGAIMEISAKQDTLLLVRQGQVFRSTDQAHGAPLGADHGP